MVQDEKNAEQISDSRYVVCKQCGEYHYMSECDEFLDVDVSSRWNVACIHRRLDDHIACERCSKTRICVIDGCKQNHHKLLHGR